MNERFTDRAQAGRLLADKLKRYANHPSTVVLGIPRGGVPVAYQVARELHLPMDIFVVRKLGVPAQPELAMGAVADGGAYYLNNEVVSQIQISDQEIQDVLRREECELERRERLYRQGRAALPLTGQTVILVDDGVATGSSVRAAIRVLQLQKPSSIILAVPVAPADTCESLRGEVDRLVCLESPDPFHAVGAWYKDFSPTSDQEVTRLLKEAAAG